jgi:hypothetical protein
LRDALGDEDFENAWANGQTLDLDASLETASLALR